MTTNNKERILFVCLGNICRSPLAEGIMRNIQGRYQLLFELDSAGTSDYHTGEAPDPRTIKNALKNGVDLSKLRARTFTKHDLEVFDFIYVMDNSNFKNLVSTYKNSVHLNKISLLPNPDKPSDFVEIPDPYFGDENGFEADFQLLHKSIHSLCLRLSETN